MAAKYPQYQVSQWIDTSEEAMNKAEATIHFGVRIKEKGRPWMHCAKDNEPLLFDTAEKASGAILEMKAGHNAKLTSGAHTAPETE